MPYVFCAIFLLVALPGAMFMTLRKGRAIAAQWRPQSTMEGDPSRPLAAEEVDSAAEGLLTYFMGWLVVLYIAPALLFAVGCCVLIALRAF